MELISIRIPGRPVQQGSKKVWAAKGKNGYTGKVSSKEMNPRLGDFRQDVKTAVSLAGIRLEVEEVLPYKGPVTVHLGAYFKRPGKGAECRDCPCGRGTPDLDKIQRAVGDALQLAGVIKDDAQITVWYSAAHYVDGDDFTSITVWANREAP